MCQSELWGGRVSEEVITEKCGILDLIERETILWQTEALRLKSCCPEKE